MIIEALVFSVALSLGYSVAEDLESAPAYEIQVGGKYFAWAGYSEPTFRHQPSGQTFKNLDVLSFGIGARWRIAEKTKLVLQAGYFDPETNYSPGVMREAVRNSFEANAQHAQFHPTNFKYELDPDYGFLIGVEHKATDSLSVWGRFRALRLNQFVEMWDQRIGKHDIDAGEPDCGCWFQRHDSVNANAFELGVKYEF